MLLAFAASKACAATAIGIASTITAPALALTAWFTHAAVADGLASPLHVFSWTPAFPSAVRRPLVTAWKNSTLSVIGMYQTVFPDSDLTFLSCGPGGGKLVVGLASAATFSFAAATPGPPPPPELLDFFDDPHPAASSATATVTASAAASRSARRPGRPSLVVLILPPFLVAFAADTGRRRLGRGHPAHDG